MNDCCSFDLFSLSFVCHVCACTAECGYTPVDIAAFGHAGNRPNTNPAEQVLFDLYAKGIGIDELYRMFFQMKAKECMDIIEDDGKSGTPKLGKVKLDKPRGFFPTT